jgi:hypothetical protein
MNLYKVRLSMGDSPGAIEREAPQPQAGEEIAHPKGDSPAAIEPEAAQSQAAEELAHPKSVAAGVLEILTRGVVGGIMGCVFFAFSRIELAAGIFFSDRTWEIWPLFLVLSGVGGAVTGVLLPIGRWLLGRIVLGFIAMLPMCTYVSIAKGEDHVVSTTEFALIAALGIGSFFGISFGAVVDRMQRKEDGDEGEAVREALDDIRLGKIKIYWPDPAAESPPGIAPAHLPLIKSHPIQRTVEVKKNAAGFARTYNHKVLNHLRAVERSRSGRIKPLGAAPPRASRGDETLRHCADCCNLFTAHTLICPECGDPTVPGDLPETPAGER